MFRKDFAWGVASSAYQIEGAAKEDGRSQSVWDVYLHDHTKNAMGHHGDVTCDHYHRFREDVALMKELGVKAYRFSIAWPRLIPEGVGRVNRAGVEFYNALIDDLIAAGIEPYLTLFHWDYPQALEERGGWLNDDSPAWFEEYARTVYGLFADRVKYFITINEPQCFIGNGYNTGWHAPGRTLPAQDVIHMAHNVLKAHGRAVVALREMAPGCLVGYMPTISASIPASNDPADVEAARKHMFDVTRDSMTWNVAWWSDPVLLGRYPEETEGFQLFGQYLPENWRDDMPLISTPIDFYGQNLYHGTQYRAKDGGYEALPLSLNTPRTANGWTVTPDALYWAPKFLYERYHKPLVIGENGMACHDAVSLDGKVHDPNRINYLHRYLRELSRAVDDGVDVIGYMQWSFTDSLEWCEGFHSRFGLVYVDYETQERIKKDSFEWYSEVIRENGNNL